ncbi:hypothetical protein Gocc_2111 [Gaiella occulta]|uniref:Uncharacterized protein n=1 Tax=Gaiella occulta TaxID=1002870 RepID=A0A7M2YVU7_9ACTN|nr:hypothetical protein [Gaiella occulta]RDI74014.1 hypothetical protein Gocc_2111 [Gaiella occulta]
MGGELQQHPPGLVRAPAGERERPPDLVSRRNGRDEALSPPPLAVEERRRVVPLSDVGAGDHADPFARLQGDLDHAQRSRSSL